MAVTSRRVMYKHYAAAVIAELQKMGYPADEAKKVFFRHYRDMKRLFGLEANPNDFAAMIDEFERSSRQKYDPNNPNHIYVGHLRERVKKANKKKHVRTVRVMMPSSTVRIVTLSGQRPVKVIRSGLPKKMLKS